MWRTFLCLGLMLASASAAPDFTALRLVADLNPGQGHFGAQNFFVWKGQVWFVAGRDEEGKTTASLFCSDGSKTGTRRIKDIPWQWPGSMFDNPFVFDGRLYFQGPNAALGKGSQLWVTDGTESGTKPISEAGKDVCKHFQPFLVGERLVLPMHGDYKGHGLAALNLHTLETEFIAVPFDGWEDYTEGAMLNGAMLKLDQNGEALWRIDGTSAGLKKLALPGLPKFELQGGFQQLLALPNGVLMMPKGSERPLEMWYTDGKSVVKLAALEWPKAAILPHWFGQVGERGVFLANDHTRHCGLWSSDGTKAGSGVILDSDPYKHANFSLPLANHPTPVVSGNRLYFTMDDGEHGVELWCTDGTRRGTHLVIDIALGNQDAEIFDIFPLADGYVLAQRKNANSGSDLWITDGTENGSRRLATFNRSPRIVAALNGMILFVADNVQFGYELHALDVPRLPTGREDPSK